MSRLLHHNEVLDRMHALMHGLKHHMRDAMRAEGEGLGMMEARCLGYFASHPGTTQSDLVQHSGRDKAQIARIVKGLIERDLLRNEPNPADGRSQVMHVSPKGAALQRRMQNHQTEFEKHLMRGLNPDERAALVALLERLERNMTAP